VQFAEESPEPEIAELYTDVYTDAQLTINDSPTEKGQ
jgi:TPP-dependent pyruvate/acetoin dehydrogenase alpha subunit